MLGESDLSLPAGPAEENLEGEKLDCGQRQDLKGRWEVGDGACGAVGTEREVEMDVAWGLSMD